LVYEPGQTGNSNIPAGLTPLSAHIRSNTIADLLSSLLASIVVAENANAAEAILRAHPGVIVVTRDGDVISRGRARGGSKSSSSLIEIKALIE
jgi:chromosome segregation protein